MFLKCHSRFKDGKEHRYWNIVENRRCGRGKFVQRQVLYLGEINDTQRQSWCRTIEIFDENREGTMRLALFPADRQLPDFAAGYFESDLVFEETDKRQRVLEHFQKCEEKKRQTAANGARITLQRLLDMLRDARVVAPPAERSPVQRTAVQCLTDRYRRHLLDDQGLAESTVVNYTWHVQKFLSEQFGAGAVNLVGLQAHDATRFIQQTARDHSTRHAQLLVAALRSFFRFLHFQGEIEMDLAPALPNVANWALSSLPKYVSADAVQRVLDQCDRQTVVGRRNYAGLLLLARLGMRGGEVLRLNLEDIDRHNARIIIRASKGPSWTQLPLTSEVGEAIGRYLRYDRPHCDCRRVFLRARAPYLALSHTAAITSLVRRALKKPGIESARKGAHLLRHSLATDMLRHGASLNEIGELLRHQSPNSTALYAKVELTALRPLALSWPGVAQ